MTALQIAGGAVLAAIAVTGSYLDLRTRRLPNWLCLAGLIAGLAFGLAAGGLTAAAIALLHALIALIVGAGLFALGGIGGGDAKFYAGLAAWFPLQAGLGLLVSVSLTGLLLLVAWLPYRQRMMRADGGMAKDSDFRKLPYGVAIAVGALVFFGMREFSI